jgi:hypothetical protein
MNFARRQLWLAGVLLAAQFVHGEPWTIPILLKRIPPLKHDATGRWPMICIEVFKLETNDNSLAQGKPFPPEVIRELLKRGLVQYIYPDEKYIPFAQALQKEGAKVIIFQGQAFNGPQGDEVKDGLHDLPADFKSDERPPQQNQYPCPLLTNGWQIRRDKIRTALQKFKEAGVTVDAVWWDWEVEPYPGRSQWRETAACPRCRSMFPAGVLDDYEKYQAFISRLRNELYSTYLAAPVREVFPKCSVTNWELVFSSVAQPTPRWSSSQPMPPQELGWFSAANPVAYGNTAWHKLNWKKEWPWPLDQAHMDRVYTQVMLGQISINERNLRQIAPTTETIPWVDRYCMDDPDPKIPMLSRERYREILRHCWLRGADGMQIFNPHYRPEDPATSVIQYDEVADAVAVYDEMLAYRKFLDHGEVMNTEPPIATDDGPLWSGLRVGDEAVVRTFTQAAKKVPVTITPFTGGPTVTLACPPAGATYLLTRTGDKIKIHQP